MEGLPAPAGRGQFGGRQLRDLRFEKRADPMARLLRAMAGHGWDGGIDVGLSIDDGSDNEQLMVHSGYNA